MIMITGKKIRDNQLDCIGERTENERLEKYIVKEDFDKICTMWKLIIEIKLIPYYYLLTNRI